MRWLPLLLLLACNPVLEPDCYPQAGRYDFTAYSIRSKTRVSPEFGFRVDDGQQLDLQRLDRTTEAVLACVNRVWPQMTVEQRRQAYCTGTAAIEIRACMTVKVPDDWYTSACTGKQIFPCSVPAASCEAKGETPTAQCPCSCRAIIQDTDLIVTAPNLELYPARLTELMTGCDQIWQTPLAECGDPGLVQ